MQLLRFVLHKKLSDRLLNTLPVLLIVLISQPLEAQSLEIFYPPPESRQDTRDEDVVALLRMALEKTVETDGQFTLKPSYQMNEERYRKELMLGRSVSVIWSTVTEETERALLSVRIPINKGILGYRVFLIRKSDQARFSAIKNLEELKKLRVGQQSVWNDVKVLKANGFNVETGPSYEGLFDMLMRGRIDYFSRGINEAPAELAARKARLPDMALEETLLLYYPWPKFFYVNKANAQLAQRIERGLNSMIKDGSLDRLFIKYNQPFIDAVNLKKRKLFKIDNPFLPPSVPLDRKELWYNPL